MTTRVGKGGFKDWADLRTHLIDAYAAAPHAATEQEIIDAYELHPDAVTKAALELIGIPTITSPWGVLKSRAAKISAPPSNPTRSTGLEREKAIMRAEQWIRAAGTHYDRETEILEELFGDRGLLRDYAQIDLIEDTSDTGKWKLTEPAGDTALVDRMLKLYNEFRPKGIAIEEDAIARAEKYKHQQQELAAAKEDNRPL